MVEYEETPFGTVVHGMKDLLKPKCENCKQLRVRIAELEAERDWWKAESERLKVLLGINGQYHEELEALKAELAEIRKAQRDAYRQEE